LSAKRRRHAKDSADEAGTTRATRSRRYALDAGTGFGLTPERTTSRRSRRPRSRRGLAEAVKVLRVTGRVRFQRGSNASRCTAMHAGGVTALEAERAHARQARLGVSLRPTRGTFPPSFWVFHRFCSGRNPEKLRLHPRGESRDEPIRTTRPER